MIIQACINGARPGDFHPRLPLTAEAMAQDGISCVAAGAAELHIHPRLTAGKVFPPSAQPSVVFAEPAPAR